MSGPPPPPPPHLRPGGGPPPPPNARPGGPPQNSMMQMPIRQQSTRIQDITPLKTLDEATCLKKLTTYGAHTIRKCPTLNSKNATWARAEVTEEKISQKEIEKQIKKLNERRSARTVTEKKTALAPNQQGQITTLLDNLGTAEHDAAFTWSLVQIDSDRKPVKLRESKRKELYETVTMTVYVKRAPREDLNPVTLFQNIERINAERMRPPPPHPPQQPHPQQNQHNHQGPHGSQGQHEPQQPGPRPGGPPPHQGPQIVRERSQSRRRESKQRSKRYHNRDDSTVSSETYDSDTASTSSSGSSSMTSQSSRSRGQRRQSKGPYRSHSRHEPKRYVANSPIHSPRPYDAYGGNPGSRPYAPEVPHVDPGVDHVIAAYQAGKQDANAERYGVNERLPAQAPVVIERLIESRPQQVVSYPRPPLDRAFSERVSPTRYAADREPRAFYDDKWVERRREDWEDRRQRAEEYIEQDMYGRPVERRQSMYERRPIEREFERRPYEPAGERFSDGRRSPLPVFDRNPFQPITGPQLRRAYPRRETPSYDDY